ncbi:response regulator [Hyalangium rubrum]|uniref:Response regulator n=1 Tax=Hyalangium rubrum TaxID=3103134 RepID=A0ABU5H8B3_9BACT|nr:response regulator [Hyalangium sp. s54d21]MDY7229714.1 response regulator [Hyalangium sp. s54d21]
MAARTHRATILEPTATASGLSPRGRRARRLRVLLVEPDARYQSLLGTGLAEAGFEVVVVPSAEDARAELAASQVLPHLVIAETELEGFDGFSFCTQLRAEARTAQLPVFLMASRREPFHAELAHSVGADDFLPKPVAAQDLVALARLKAGRRTGELSYEAHSARLPLTHIARALLTGARSGRVVLKDCDGFFAFREGKVVDASFQGARGVMAFRRLLSFGSGVYAAFFGPELHRGSLLMDLPYLSQQVLPALERFERLREVGVPLVARLAVDFPKLAEHLDALPEDVISLVRLFDGRRTVRTVLEECRFTEVVAFEAITRLFVLGVLVPASHVEERERVQDPQRLGSEAAEAWRAAFAAEERAADEREADEHEARLHEAAERQAAGTEPEAKVLAFPTPPSRRREEEPAEDAPAERFNLASGAESTSPRTADKV